jgi:cyclase
MVRSIALAGLVIAGIGTAASQTPPVDSAQGAPSDSRGASSNHRFVKVAEGVYAAHPTPAMNVGSNTAVIVTDEGVMLVDSHITPATARALSSDIRSLTTQPVRWVVNTHYHYDHAHGNPAFGPDVTIIGHEFTRKMLAAPPLEDETYRTFVDGLPAQIDGLRKRLAAESDKSGVEAQLHRQIALAEGLKEVRSAPPNLTLGSSLTIYRGGREMQLLHLGRGHTGGDVVVYLPKERILCTGDLLTAGLSYMGDAYADEWAATLEKLKPLDFTTIIPGHGEVLQGKERVTQFQGYLRDVWDQVAALRRAGVSSADAATRVDLTAHRAAFPNITGPGADPAGVARQYRVMAEREGQ